MEPESKDLECGTEIDVQIVDVRVDDSDLDDVKYYPVGVYTDDSGQEVRAEFCDEVCRSWAKAQVSMKEDNLFVPWSWMEDKQRVHVYPDQPEIFYLRQRCPGFLIKHYASRFFSAPFMMMVMAVAIGAVVLGLEIVQRVSTDFVEQGALEHGVMIGFAYSFLGLFVGLLFLPWLWPFVTNKEKSVQEIRQYMSAERAEAFLRKRKALRFLEPENFVGSTPVGKWQGALFRRLGGIILVWALVIGGWVLSVGLYKGLFLSKEVLLTQERLVWHQAHNVEAVGYAGAWRWGPLYMWRVNDRLSFKDQEQREWLVRYKHVIPFPFYFFYEEEHEVRVYYRSDLFRAVNEDRRDLIRRWEERGGSFQALDKGFLEKARLLDGMAEIVIDFPPSLGKRIISDYQPYRYRLENSSEIMIDHRDGYGDDLTNWHYRFIAYGNLLISFFVWVLFGFLVSPRRE